MLRLAPILLCAVAFTGLACSDRVVLLDGLVSPEAGVPADLPSAELRFCSGSQKVILHGQELAIVSTSATVQDLGPEEMGSAPMNLTLVLQLPSGEREQISVFLLGHMGHLYQSQCLPPLDTLLGGIGLTLYRCDSNDCSTKTPLDDAIILPEKSDLVVQGWCGFDWPKQRMSLCFKSTTLHPEKHPYLSQVQVFVPAVDVEVKPWR